MPFTFDRPDDNLISEVREALNELLSLEGLKLVANSTVYWTRVYTLSTMNIVENKFPPENPVGWRFMMAKPNLGGAVAGDFAYRENADGDKYGKTAVPVTTGIYDGPAVAQALAALLDNWGLTNPEDFEARVLRISSPSVQALWLYDKHGKAGGSKIIPYRTLADTIETKPYEEAEFYRLLKPLARKKLLLRDVA